MFVETTSKKFIKISSNGKHLELLLFPQSILHARLDDILNKRQQVTRESTQHWRSLLGSMCRPEAIRLQLKFNCKLQEDITYTIPPETGNDCIFELLSRRGLQSKIVYFIG